MNMIKKKDIIKYEYFKEREYVEDYERLYLYYCYDDTYVVYDSYVISLL